MCRPSRSQNNGQMKELQPDILNDYEHMVMRKIEQYKGEDNFPALGDDLTAEDLSEYLFEYQRYLDSPGSQKSQLTKYGIIALIPIIILSAFPEQMLPWGKYSIYVGIVIGLGVALLLKALSMLMVRRAIAKLRADNPSMSAYVDSVMKYNYQKQ